MDDFIFDGVHIGMMGATAAFGDSMTIGSKIKRRTYAMPDGSTIEFGAPGYAPITRNVTIMPADGVVADKRWARQIVTWLTNGRAKIEMLNDPDVYRIAEFTEPPTYGHRNWPTGALEMRMTLEGLAHAARSSSFQMATRGGEAEIQPVFATGLPAPLRVEISPTSGTISAATIAAGGQTVELSGLNLAQGQTLIYEAGDGHGKRAAITIDGVLAFDCCDLWRRLEVSSGETIGVTLTGGEADVRAVFRGRWVG